MRTMEREGSNYQQVVSRVSRRSFCVNFVLAAFKFAAGILGRSAAMISDAIHSASDVAGDLIVMCGAVLSERREDEDHPYGHERFENIASIILSFLLYTAGGKILLDALHSILTREYLQSALPGRIALLAAIVSIVVKEALFWYTIKASERIQSDSLKAEAWHHRSDALSSVGALVGIAGARMGVRILEPLAGLLISLFILKVAVEIFAEQVRKLTDHSCEKELEEGIISLVNGCDGVKGIDLLRTRTFGRKVYVDLEVSMDKNLSLDVAHGYSEDVHDLLEQKFPQIKHVMVHVNPA